MRLIVRFQPRLVDEAGKTFLAFELEVVSVSMDGLVAVSVIPFRKAPLADFAVENLGANVFPQLLVFLQLGFEAEGCTTVPTHKFPVQTLL